MCSAILSLLQGSTLSA